VFDAMKNQEKTDGTVVTQFLEGNIIETVYSGYISASMSRDVEVDLRKLLRRHPNADWLIDAAGATGVAVAPGESRMAVFNLFKDSTSRIAVVVSSTAVRMMAATFAFAFGVPMKSFDSRDEALSYLRTPPR
jgi:hypothetical protein